MSNNELTTDVDIFKNSIQAIMEKMNIEFIYHIDDKYEDKIEIFYANCITEIDKIENEFLAELINIDDLDLVDSFTKDQKQAYLRKELPKTSIKNIEKLKTIININNPYDDQATTIIDRMSSSDKIVKISPSNWDEKKNDYINEFKSKKILLFIDSDWSRGDPQEGLNVILELMQIDEISENVKCTLFTHLYTENEQFKKREELSTQYNIPLEKLLVISKQDRDDSNFIRDFRTAAIMPTLKILKDKIHAHIIDSSNDVKNYISNELDIIDLEYITLDKSAKEGDWEPSILYRLHSNRHIKEFRRKVFNDNSIQENILLMRELKKLSPDVAIFSSKTKEIMENELYDDKVNDYNCPLKSGDIFENNSGKKFILLMQPCEIMIRNNGKRSNDDYKTYANLIEISSAAAKKTDAELKYLDGETYYLQYAKIKKVELDILDLCTFSNEGKTGIDLNLTTFDHKLEGLTLRYKILQKKYDSLYTLWKNNGGAGELKAPLFIPNGKGILTLTLNNQGSTKYIDFGLKRIKKLSKDVAQDLLSKLLTHLSRAAHDVDLAN